MFEMDVLGQPVVVEDLDADWVLDLLEQSKVAGRIAERTKLRLAARWCRLHPATAESGVATWGGESLPGVLGGDESLGGEGTPAVSAFVPEPVGAALGISTTAAMALIADALDLQHRLPRIWRLVESLEVEPWKARRVAQATHTLSKQAAADVDARLAPRLASCGARAIGTAVAHAIATHHPELLAEREQHGRSGWHVTLHQPRPGDPGGEAGTSWLDIAGDSLDLAAFHDLVCAEAAALQAAGDTDDLEVRKAKALGVIATRQATLDLTSTVTPAPRRKPRVVLYAHVSLTELLGLTSDTVAADDGCPTPTGSVERLGPATLDLIKDWVARADVTIRPVLDRQSIAPVDGHDPTPAMREAVILRDRHCVFPWCGVDARNTDQDHIDPYVPIDLGGPPRQTHPDNLAALCRRHHRCKTSGRWRYRRRPDGTYEWQGPHGRSYLVGPTGTIPLDAN